MGINPTNGNNQHPWVPGDQSRDNSSPASSRAGDNFAGHHVSTQPTQPTRPTRPNSNLSAARNLGRAVAHRFSLVRDFFSGLFGRQQRANVVRQSSQADIASGSYRFVGSMKGSQAAQQTSDKISTAARDSGELSGAFSSSSSSSSADSTTAASGTSDEASVDTPDSADTGAQDTTSVDTPDSAQTQDSSSRGVKRSAESGERVVVKRARVESSSSHAQGVKRQDDSSEESVEVKRARMDEATSSTSLGDEMPSTSSGSVGGSTLAEELKRTLEMRNQEIHQLSVEIRDRWLEQENRDPEAYRNLGLLTLSSRMQQLGVAQRMEIFKRPGIGGTTSDLGSIEEDASELWATANTMWQAQGSGDGLLVLSSVALAGPSLPEDASVASFVHSMIDSHMDPEDPDDFVSGPLMDFAEQVDQRRASGDSPGVSAMWAALASSGASLLSDISSSGQSFDAFMGSHGDVDWNNSHLDSLQAMSPSVYGQVIQVLASDVFLD